ncbi:MULTISPECIES: IS3-like element ISBmu11 family transposase [Burkholderia cepacia complex]|uniref:IS3-like element ISBmu11 family transposase n=1 Tax=Burkholderia cenocepacia TaxID=95486 RepID=A0A427NJ71_9BURK|nr:MULTISPECIES: IS3-like element ISBmu11 family transposase [Burkholderia cepacia complex]AMU19175.1 integrase [Burkholderia cenocepacia]MCA8030942.1 IS3-like element ISBmu11 family transposase [Burkholderia cepacia]MDI9701315.1 IS3-like element ISBmu11 family transposase [Burkholderia cenocepacia]RSC02805.1 IS3-like element ISBmu11 family transposase [Burkholderia cenocepacia]HDR9878165.1 IS3-like element ISBmu11 family transposase [Burkholderia cenocepacia]
MYSYEDRVRAVELYLKLGKRVKATIRQLGYPTKNSLKAWCEEFEKSGDLQKEYVRVKPKYSEEQKNLALEHYVNHGRSFSFTLRALGYPCRQILTAWVRERYPETRKRVVGKAGRPAVSLATRQLAVYELCTREGSAQAVAQKLDVDRVSLYNWKNQLLGRGAPASMKRDKGSPSETDRDELERQVEELRRDIRNLKLEHDLLKKANELVKKDLGVDLSLLSNREKTTLVDALREEYGLTELLERLDLARSSYFYHRSPIRVADKYADVRRTVAEIFEDNHRSYGYRRVQAALSRQRVFLSEKVVRRLMKQGGLHAARPKRRRYRSYIGEISPAPDNIINRDFHANAPNEKWVTDISEFQIPAGKVYLSPMIDCFDGMVVSWSIGTSPDAELVNSMLDAAIETVTEDDETPIVHSDRGGHYRWPGWLSRVAKAKLIRSMSRKACSPDNAACEGFFGRLKTEMFYPGDWRSTTIAEFVEVLNAYVRWYNEKRIKGSLGYLSPIEYRESLGLAT